MEVDSLLHGKLGVALTIHISTTSLEEFSRQHGHTKQRSWISDTNTAHLFTSMLFHSLFNTKAEYKDPTVYTSMKNSCFQYFVTYLCRYFTRGECVLNNTTQHEPTVLCTFVLRLQVYLEFCLLSDTYKKFIFRVLYGACV